MLALVLARKNFREFDQTISLYTREQGKLEVLAKGIKKIISKNSANLKILSLVEAEITQGKEIDYLTKVQPLKIFKNIDSNLEKISTAGYAARIADANILAGEADERIFNLLVGFLEFINSTSEINSLNLATGFIFKLWHCLGFSAAAEKHEVWLEGNWQMLNDLSLSENERQNFYESALEYAQIHSGRKLARIEYLC